MRSFTRTRPPHQIFNKNPAPGTRHPAPGTRHPAPATEIAGEPHLTLFCLRFVYFLKHPAPSTQHRAPSTRAATIAGIPILILLPESARTPTE